MQMSAIVITVCSLAVLYLADTLLVGIAYQALKMRFGWNFSIRRNLAILIVIFFVVDTYLLPMFWVMDVTYTINNPSVAAFFDIPPNAKLSDLLEIGLYELIFWSIQALAAGFVGEKLLVKKPEPSRSEPQELKD